MGYYKWNGNGDFQDNRNDRSIAPGEVVELDERIVGNHDFVEVDEPPGGGSDEITCANEDCSRTVDEVGEYCWQHPLDE